MATLKSWNNPKTKMKRPANYGLPDTSQESGSPQTRFLLDQLSRQVNYVTANASPASGSEYGASRACLASSRSSKSKEQGGGGSSSGGDSSSDHHKRIVTYKGKGLYLFEFRCYIHRPQCWDYTSLSTCDLTNDWCCSDDWSGGFGAMSLQDDFWVVFIDDKRYFEQFFNQEFKRDLYSQYPNDPLLHWLRPICHYYVHYEYDNRGSESCPLPEQGEPEYEEYETCLNKLKNIRSKYVQKQQDSHTFEGTSGYQEVTKNGITRVLSLRYPRGWTTGYIPCLGSPSLSETYDADWAEDFFEEYY